jgi:DEAD/DEAH box helicase domain-containing protein
VLNGYPGTIAGTWRRLGRGGRRQRTAVGVLMASSLPLHQYIIRNPDFFLGASPEQACIDPDQLLFLLDDIRCAAFELPFKEGDRWHWMAHSYPASSVSLRSVAEGNFVVVEPAKASRQ